MCAKLTCLRRPHHCQCQKTSRLLKERLGWADTDIVTTFQARSASEELLKPYTVKESRACRDGQEADRRDRGPAFSADCIETLEEINDEIHESFEEGGW